MVSCQRGPTRHAYTWQIGPFWQDTLELLERDAFPRLISSYSFNQAPIAPNENANKFYESIVTKMLACI